jgi:hypothetical protein
MLFKKFPKMKFQSDFREFIVELIWQVCLIRIKVQLSFFVSKFFANNP